MLTKEEVVGMIVVYKDLRLEVRDDIVVYEDGVEISRTSTFYAILPGDKVPEQKMVKDITGAIWTPEIIKARFDKLKEPIDTTIPDTKFPELPSGLAIPSKPNDTDK